MTPRNIHDSHMLQPLVEKVIEKVKKPLAVIKQIYARSKETIELVFADAKEKHGIRWTTLRGIKKLSMHAC